MSRNLCSTVCPECGKYVISMDDVLFSIHFEVYFQIIDARHWSMDLYETGGNLGHGWDADQMGLAICRICGRGLAAWLKEGVDRDYWVSDLSYWESFNDEPGQNEVWCRP